jgi:hypothetical protein
LSGDEIKPAMQIMGDIGYGGPIGFMFSCAQMLFEAIFGDDIGGTAIALITGDEDEQAASQMTDAAAAARDQLASLDEPVPLPRPTETEAATAYAVYGRERGTHR